MTAKELDLWALLLGFVDETLAEVRKSYKELSGEDFAADSRVVTAGWARWYERSSTVHYIVALAAIGVGPSVLKLSPPRLVRERLERLVAGASISLDRNIQAIALYGQPLNELSHSEDGLLKGISLEPMLIATKAGQRLLGRALLSDDDVLVGKIGARIRNRPKPLQQRDMGQIDAGLWLLHRAGALRRLTREDAYELFVARLGWYYAGKDGDAVDSLWRKVRRTKEKLSGR